MKAVASRCCKGIVPWFWGMECCRPMCGGCQWCTARPIKWQELARLQAGREALHHLADVAKIK